MKKRRVVVTGIGTVNALGNNVSEFWENAKAGKIGIAPITCFDTANYRVKIAAEVKNLEPKKYLPRKIVRRSERFVQLGLIAAKEAIEDSGIRIDTEDCYKIGVCVGSAIGGLSRISQETIVLDEYGPDKVNPYTVPLVISNMVSSNIAMLNGLRGKCLGLVSACATGTDSVGEAFTTIVSGQCDAMVAGGADSIVCPQGISSFQQLSALTTETNPARASIPFDKNRRGFVMGEGAGILVLEELDHAKRRNAPIYGEILGYASTNDAYHITMPREDGEGAAKAMEAALANAGIASEQVDYINAHGTSTYFNDLYETFAIKKMFAENAYNIPINSTKSLIGHTLAAAGAIETIVCLLSMKDSYVHVTAGLKNMDENCDLNFVKECGKEHKIEYAMSNSFGFGGHNSSLILGSIPKGNN